MAEKAIPWWRKALMFALGGIRSGFGFFPRAARQESGTEPVFSGSLEERREEETGLTDPSPQSEDVGAEAEESVSEIVSETDEVVEAFVEVEPEAEPEEIAEFEAVSEAIAEQGESVETFVEVESEAELEETAVVEDVIEIVPESVEFVDAFVEVEPEAEPEEIAEFEPVDEAIPEHEESAEAFVEAEPEVEPEELAEFEAVDETIPEHRESAEAVVEAGPEATEIAEVEDVNEIVPEAVEVVEAFVEVEPGAEPEEIAEAEAINEIARDAVEVVEAVVEAEVKAAEQVDEKDAEKAAAKLAARQIKLDESSEQSPFSVFVGQVYDGPLDLLLDLIRKQDIDIYDIPIARITAQFLAYVNQLKAGDVDVAGEFIYTASLLIHIKSKMLLPRAPAGPEDVAEDPRRELVERLLEHERFKNAAQMLQQKQMLEAASWSNPGIREFKEEEAAEPEIAADTVDLVRVFREILERARTRPILDVEEDSVTVDQMIQFLARRLNMEDKPVALRRLLSHTRSERALIAIFLALLEMVRIQAVLLRQDRAFSEIFVKKHTGFDAVMNEGLMNARDDWR
jgi:segregation and condensation protein A